MSLLSNLRELGQQPKQQNISVVLAGVGAIPGVPLAGLHKFYLGQPLWGVAYFCLSWTLIPHIASACEAVWYLRQERSQFDARFNDGVEMPPPPKPKQEAGLDPKEVQAIATALRELEQLRQEGLLSEYEFEQKRRQLVNE
ncbi:MAG: NINE protein [Spirulina sp. SIO3F2]|nr:NINE protein [Spirulina sp. SIO3F2]